MFGGGGKQIFIWNLNRLLGMAGSQNISGKLGYHIIISTFHGHNTERTLHSNTNKVISTLLMIRTNFIAKLYFWNSIYCSCLPLLSCSTYRTLALIPNQTTVWLCTNYKPQGLELLKFALVLVTNMYKNNNLFTPSDIKISSATFHCYFPSVREKHLTS